MAQSHSLKPHRPEAHEDVRRVYAVNCNAPPTQGRCVLDDGSVLLCAFRTMEAAIEATADDPSLRLVRHRSLDAEEQERIEEALLA